LLFSDFLKRKENIDKIPELIGDIFNQFMDMAHSYGKSIIVASDLPFGGSYLESKMLQKIGERGGVCFTLPDHAAVVFASLARYAEYLRESNLGVEANSICTG